MDNGNAIAVVLLLGAAVSAVLSVLRSGVLGLLFPIRKFSFVQPPWLRSANLQILLFSRKFSSLLLRFQITGSPDRRITRFSYLSICAHLRKSAANLVVAALRRASVADFFSILLTVMLFGSVVVAQAPASDFQTELEAGKQAATQSNYAEAAKHFNKANELRQEKCSECYVWLARMDMGTGSLQQALTLTEKAVATAATSTERASAQLYRGVVLGRQGKLPEAEVAFKAASTANPACVECRFNLGFVLLKESKDAEGVAVLKTVASEFAGTPRGHEIERLIANPDRIRKNYAPEFSAKLSTGEEINLDTLKGKVVLLDFWGTWCEPCRVSLPLLKDLAAKVDPAKVAIISIDEYDPKSKWEQYVHTNGMTWGQVYDSGLSLHNAFGVDGFPRYYILNKEGIIVAQFKGWNQNGESTIADAITLALKQ